MKFAAATVVLMLFAIPLLADEAEWSKSVRGVRARLSLERAKDSPFLKVFIEFQNTSEVQGIIRLRFTPDSIQADVRDGEGRPLKTAAGPYDALTPVWDTLLLPTDGTLKFRISFPGAGYRPGKVRTLIDLGPPGWAIPDDKPYFLSGILKIPSAKGDHPIKDWSGTLKLPRIPIPTN